MLWSSVRLEAICAQIKSKYKVLIYWSTVILATGKDNEKSYLGANLHQVPPQLLIPFIQILILPRQSNDSSLQFFNHGLFALTRFSSRNAILFQSFLAFSTFNFRFRLTRKSIVIIDNFIMVIVIIVVIIIHGIMMVMLMMLVLLLLLMLLLLRLRLLYDIGHHGHSVSYGFCVV
jgi:hypothetical protein